MDKNSQNHDKNEEKYIINSKGLLCEKISSQQNEAEPSNNTKTAKLFLGTAAQFFLVLICVFAIISAIAIGGSKIQSISENVKNSGAETSFFTALFKKIPSIDANPTIEIGDKQTWIYLGAEFVVDCTENYNEIVILTEWEDHNGVIYKCEYITFMDCEEGKKYSQTYTLSAEEILKTKDLHYELYKYK